MFDRILIANRGEIACRIARTARRLGIGTVAVYSQADAGARHVRMADEAVFLGASEPKESYLAVEKIIAAAQRTGAQAIHPGYGFLSENERLRQACDEAGLAFVGPPLAALRAMGSKSQAKALMQAAGVPLAPGYHGDDQEPERLQDEANAIGYPVLVKPALGGGGKGMRLVETAEEFSAALASCQREAASSFGDDRVLIEKYISRPRHIEIQIFADAFGDCISLFERDCSTQRRHQKILEEAPAPGLSETRRRAMSEAAIAAAKAVDYIGAGTVEFVVAPDGAFYFIEMNARLQVEHPVTECITGLDLVEWQLRVAAGERLPLHQDQIILDGHALEARLYAEDPAKNFIPATGRLRYLQWPEQSRDVRVDSGVDEGDSVTPFYDPMIAKLIVWDENRDKALARMRRALAQVHIVGLANNVEFLSRLVSCPSFVNGDLDTDLIERESALLFAPGGPPPREAAFIVALAALLSEREPEATSPWSARDNWRLNGEEPRLLSFSCAGETFIVAVRTRGDSFALGCGDVEMSARAERKDRGVLCVELDGLHFEATVVATESGWRLFLDCRAWTFDSHDPLRVAEREDTLSGGLTAPMSGRVTALVAQPGKVRKGAPLMILEAMKMEHVVAAPADGVLNSFLFALGDQVTEGVSLIAFEPDPEV
jgi:3-methylcrotonyl-CoA carboxylase alpha subunit